MGARRCDCDGSGSHGAYISTCLTALLSHKPESRARLHKEARLWSEWLALQEGQVRHLEEALQEWRPSRVCWALSQLQWNIFIDEVWFFGKGHQRVTWAIYKRKTNHYCWGCRCYLCYEPPQNGKDLHGRKFLKNFSVKVPKVKKDGTPLSATTRASLSFSRSVDCCLAKHYIAHHEYWYWKNNYENKSIMSVVSESTRESSVESNLSTSGEGALEALLHSYVTSTTR